VVIRVARVTLCLVVLTVAACGPGRPSGRPGHGTAAELDGRTFLSTEVTENGAPRPLVAGTRIAIRFHEGKLDVNGGCNYLSGGYRLDSATLVVSEIAMTDMACLPNARMDQDTWLADLLTGRPTIDVDGETLVLTGAGVQIRMTDRRVVDPDRPLAGPRWRVESIITGDAVASAPQGEAYLAFAADGQVSGYTGCNQLHGTYQAADATVTFGQMSLTKKACFGAAAALETAVTALFDGRPVSYRIEADQMTLTLPDGTGGLQLRAAA
jgi:heat shock protein HslJ